MSQVTPAEEQRIIAHMNKDHAESLAWYLELWGKAPLHLTTMDPKLTSFTTPEMVIEYGREGMRRTYTHKFEPPMLAGQARTRLVEMHEEARKALKISDATINEFWIDSGVIFGVASMFMPLIMLNYFTPTQIETYASMIMAIGREILAMVPIRQTDANAINAILVVFYTTLFLIHVVEVGKFTLPLLRRFNTKDPGVRAKWILLTIFMGVGAWKRLQTAGLKKEREIAKTKKAH